MKKFIQIIFTLSAAITANVSIAEALTKSTPEEVGISSERLNNVTNAMRRYIDRNELAGVVTLISRKGKIVHFESQGWKSKERSEEMSNDTIFTIMSMTKPIVSVALMMLYEEGYFLLTDPIEDWIPEISDKQVIIDPECLQNCVSARREAESKITFRHVLAHTSGLDPSRDNLGKDEIDLLARKNTLEETIVNRARLPLAFDPGESWQYGSSTDYVALLVERISGKPLKEFLQERIFDPLGMDDTYYEVPDEKRSRVSAVYSPDGPDQTIKLARNNEYSSRPLFGGDFYGGTAGLYSTASDYWRFSQMLLNGGELNETRLLSPKTISLMISNHSGDGDVYIRGPGYSFGLGFGILSNAGEARDPLTPGSFTWGGAWGTIFFVDPVEEMIGIMMTQITSYRHLTVRQDFGVTAMQSIVDSNMPVIGYPIIP
tara:strand:+ start:6745 stop:8037 length:1293 start_codon:yes stop_codon:yes gene_type:complete